MSSDDEQGYDLNVDGFGDSGQWKSLYQQDMPNARPTSPLGQSMMRNLDDDIDTPGVSPECAEIFSIINNYQPNPVDLTVHWKGFLPDLKPAIGNIDAFIKIQRPDGDFEELGLTIVDEPSIAQSNPQILKMELREKYGVATPANATDGYIGAIEDAKSNNKALLSWLESLEEIHRSRPPQEFMFTSSMPEVDELMEPWSEKMEEVLNSIPIPPADIDMSFEDYAKAVCAILGVPVKNSLVESLYMVFTLHESFKTNPHFIAQRNQKSVLKSDDNHEDEEILIIEDD